MTGPVSPDVRAVFDGDADPLLAAIREVGQGLVDIKRKQSDLNRTQKDGKLSADRLTRSLVDLGTVLGARRIVQFVADQVNAADAMGKLSQKTGVATEALSVFAFAGKTADVTLDDLERTFSKLSKSTEDLSDGSPDVAKAFRAIGLSAKDLEGLTLEQKFLKIADAQAKYASGAGKLDALQTILGKSASELIPYLNQLADGGFVRAREEAERLGLVMSQETADSAGRLKDEIDTLKAQVAGAALEFTGTLTPALGEFAKAASDALAKLSPQLRTGAAAGLSAAAGLLALASAGRLVGLAVGKLNPVIGVALVGLSLLAGALAVQKQKADEARDAYEKFLNTINDPEIIKGKAALASNLLAEVNRQIADKEEAIRAAEQDSTDLTAPKLREDLKELRRQRDNLDAEIRSLAARRSELLAAPGEGKKDTEDTTDLTAVGRARAEAAKAAAKDELAVTKQRNAAIAQENESAFAQGQRSLSEYFDARRELAQRATDAEIAALQQERAALARSPIKADKPEEAEAERIRRAAQLRSLDAQITAQRIEGTVELARLDEEERQRRLALGAEVLQKELALREAKGETHELAMEQIRAEAAALDALLRQQGESDAERKRRVDDLTATLTAKQVFGEADAAAGGAFAALTRAREEYTNAVATGALTEREAMEATAALIRSQLPGLRQLADAMEAAASQLGPEAVEHVKEFRQSLDNMEASADLVAQRLARIREELVRDIESHLANLVSTTLTDVSQVGDALLELVDSIAETIVNAFATNLAGEIGEQLRRGLRDLTEPKQKEEAAKDGADVAAGAVAVGVSAGRLSDAGAKVEKAGRVVLAAAVQLSAAAKQLAAANASGGEGGASDFSQLIGVGLSIGSVLPFASGGVVPGSGTGDTVPIMATPGEGILTVREMQQLARFGGFQSLRRFLGATGGELPPIRRRGVDHYAGGGVVRESPSAGPGLAKLDGELRISLEDGLVARLIESDAGTGAVIRVASNRATDLRAAMELDR